MTAIERAKTIIESLKNGAIPPPLSVKIVSRFLAASGIDTTSMDDEQKAEAFLTELKTLIKNYNTSAAIVEVQLKNRVAEEAAAANAHADFN